jgi:hypothetical protein
VIAPMMRGQEEVPEMLRLSKKPSTKPKSKQAEALLNRYQQAQRAKASEYFACKIVQWNALLGVHCKYIAGS